MASPPRSHEAVLGNAQNRRRGVGLAGAAKRNPEARKRQDGLLRAPGPRASRRRRRVGRGAASSGRAGPPSAQGEPGRRRRGAQTAAAGSTEKGSSEEKASQRAQRARDLTPQKKRSRAGDRPRRKTEAHAAPANPCALCAAVAPRQHARRDPLCAVCARTNALCDGLAHRAEARANESVCSPVRCATSVRAFPAADERFRPAAIPALRGARKQSMSNQTVQPGPAPSAAPCTQTSAVPLSRSTSNECRSARSTPLSPTPRAPDPWKRMTFAISAKPEHHSWGARILLWPPWTAAHGVHLVRSGVSRRPRDEQEEGHGSCRDRSAAVLPAVGEGPRWPMDSHGVAREGACPRE